jgi:energy-coupling factor transporter ATP-binding protein EcfA2
VVCVQGAGDWQRVLIAQVLPVVAALRGLHVIHASAVAFDDGAIALAGASGAGKSTLAAELARAGHPMLAEDVLALRLEQGSPVAEPGVSLPELPRAPHPLPLRALYLLGEHEGGEPSPRDLMATSFVPYLSGAAGPLELAATLARCVTVAHVRVDRTRPPSELAARIVRHAESANPPAAFSRA